MGISGGVRVQLLHTMNLPACRARNNETNVPGAYSARVQEPELGEVDFVGFTSERRGQFGHYQTPGPRPDYYLPHGETVILFEAERGNTAIDNLDRVDFWK